jgi:hypothetical protein
MEPLGPKVFKTAMLGRTAMERAAEVNRAVEAYVTRYGVTCPPKTGPRIMRVLDGEKPPRRTACARVGLAMSRSSAF